MSPNLDALGCPECHASLQVFDGDPAHGHELVCSNDGRRYPVVGGIPRLIRPGGERSVLDFAREYSDVWRKDGWGGTDPSYLLSLPYRDTTGRESAKWKLKARSLDALLAFVKDVRPQTVADMGCGVGWLSYHLARSGCRVYAVDAVADEVLGLQAAGVYMQHGVHFDRVQGELTAPPFQDAALDLVVYNASLHYVASTPDALAEASRVLKPGGVVVVMNSPVHEDIASARRAETDFRDHLRGLGASESLARMYHHFVRTELVAALQAKVGPVQEIPYDSGLGFRWIRRAKGIALRMELARFPILWARNRGGQREIYRPSAMRRTG